ncbi:MAG TPA: YchJ family metal-binding protein [Gammaproteobacteria bacterium]|nr:YchJ family metal-binding protein [Gammaproteobacteria bacterium]
MKNLTQACPCGSQTAYSFCCSRFLSGMQTASTPEELMRSRYTAYSLADIGYIQRTMKPPAALGFKPEEAFEWANSINWLRLEVIKTSCQGIKGSVEFKAYYQSSKKEFCIHEVSEFRLEEGSWYYVDGTMK